MKRCSMCGKHKEYKEFSKNATIKDGYQGYCKICAKQYREKRGLNKGTAKGRPKQPLRTCNRCNEEKGVEEFNSHYFCKACRLPKRKKKFTDEELKERRKLSSRKSYYKNRHRWAKKKPPTKEKRNAWARAYRATPMGKAVDKATKHMRRDVIKQSDNNFTGKEWLALLNKTGHVCLACKCTDCQLTPDHVKPLALGGSNDITNIQPLCLPCNVKKGAKEIDYR